MKYKIKDIAFGHQPNMSWHWKSERGIEWYRGDDYYDTCFFADRELNKVDSVQAKRKIAILVEPPAILNEGYNFIRENHSKFDYILTYSQEMIAIDPKKFLFYPMAMSWIPKEDRGVCNKTKVSSIVASFKKDTEGHRLRHAIVERYGNKWVDVFGCGFREFKHPKTPFLAPYMFSFAIINSVCDDYWTEIVTDCFTTGTVPIYWGTKNIANYYNPDGIIFLENVDHAYEIIKEINAERYQKMLPAVRENFEIANKYITAEDYMYDHYKFLFE
jgi:hypothetical protein